MSVEDDKLRTRLAEIMSSAGLGYNQISLEILYLLPKDFVDRYIQLWEKALGPTSGGTPGVGQAQAGELGKATDTGKHRGLRPMKAAGGGKKFKKIFVIKDEKALYLKGKVDRRLRGIARDIRLELENNEKLGGEGAREGSGDEHRTAQCTRCGRIGQGSWKFCPYDGSAMTLRFGEVD